MYDNEKQIGKVNSCASSHVCIFVDRNSGQRVVEVPKIGLLAHYGCDVDDPNCRSVNCAGVATPPHMDGMGGDGDLPGNKECRRSCLL